LKLTGRVAPLPALALAASVTAAGGLTKPAQ